VERRSHPRVQVSHPVLYSSNNHPRPKVASTLDLSAGGIRIETPYNLMVGETLKLSVAIHPQVIECKGEVVHVLWLDGETLKAGVRFEELSKLDRLYLGQHISYVKEQRA
jgi:c-di-GMP-binding flagellar brake protein YcgR